MSGKQSLTWRSGCREGGKWDWAEEERNRDADMKGTPDDPLGSTEAELPSRDAPNQARELDLHAPP